jgi:N utilization substance protein B
VNRPYHAAAEPIEPARIESGEQFENDPDRDRQLSHRRVARERVMQLLYAHAIGGRDTDALFFELVQKDLANDEAALNFARELIRRISVNREEIDRIISENLQNWQFERVALLDRLLIQMGIAELLYFPDIPPKATINELIEIGKDYSTDESSKFINGMLHAVLSHLREPRNGNPIRMNQAVKTNNIKR